MIPRDAADGPDLLEGELILQGRVRGASNHTFLATIGTGAEEIAVVYKPIRGEQPLWDFPDGRLAYREVAAFLVSEATGWDLVPPTWLRSGPHGEGMVQIWVESDPSQEAVTIVPAGEVPAGYLGVFDGIGQDDRPVTLAHEDSAVLRRIAILDVLINNADRKGGHILESDDGHRYAIDHGIAFHQDPKLRTVLWGWAGSALTADELAVAQSIRHRLDADLGDELGFWLSTWDLEALVERVDTLLRTGVFPVPGDGWPAIPWPPF